MNLELGLQIIRYRMDNVAETDREKKFRLMKSMFKLKQKQRIVKGVTCQDSSNTQPVTNVAPLTA